MIIKNNWRTFYGKTMKVTELSHQHISNILWYFELVLALDMNDIYLIRKELNCRFGGIQLPYHPNLAFRSEIDELVRLGYTSHEIDAPIIVQGKWIVSLKYN